MAWLGSTSYASATAVTNTLIENLNKDIRTWGGNVDAGANGLANAAFLTLNPGSAPGTPANGMFYVTAGNVLKQYYSAAWHVFGAVETWSAVTLQGSWTTAGGTFYTPAAVIALDGLLRLSGGCSITSYTNGSDVFQLPSASMYPTKQLQATVLVSDATAGVSYVGLLVIRTTGMCVLYSAAGAGHAVSFWVDGLSVRIA